MDKVIKRLPVEVEVKENSVVFIASTSTPDRMGDVIEQSGWILDNFKKNPVILWGHNADELPIGKASNVWIDDKGLQIEVAFASKEYDKAHTVEQLVRGGFLNAVSVGFMPVEYEPRQNGDGLRFTKNELLEVSVVSIPANADALVQMRGLKMDVAKLIADKFVKPNKKDTALLLSKALGWKEKSKLYRSFFKEVRKLLGIAEYEVEDEVKAITQAKDLLIEVIKQAKEAEVSTEKQGDTLEKLALTPKQLATLLIDAIKK